MITKFGVVRTRDLVFNSSQLRVSRPLSIITKIAHFLSPRVFVQGRHMIAIKSRVLRCIPVTILNTLYFYENLFILQNIISPDPLYLACLPKLKMFTQSPSTKSRQCAPAGFSQLTCLTSFSLNNFTCVTWMNTMISVCCLWHRMLW
jgi:hypothetical protein